MNNLKKLLGAAAVIIILLIILLIVMVLKKNRTEEPVPQVGSHAQTATPSDTEETTEAGEFTYVYEDGHINGEELTPQNTDGKIYQINTTTKAKTLVIPSVKAVIPALKENEYTFLSQVGESKDKSSLYFTQTYIEGAGKLFKFDGKTKKITEMKISNYYESFGATFSTKSPYITSIFNPKNSEDGGTLFLLDLDNDTTKVLATLPANQTFNICGLEGCLGTIGANVEWLTASQFQISIYDAKAGKDKDGNPQAKLIEKRKFNIN